MRTRPSARSTLALVPLVAGAALIAPRFVRADPPAAAHATLRAPEMPVTRYTLANGLEVILHEDHRTPTVAVNLWYHVGSKDEPQGRNGFAHLFEHLMFQGSRHVAEDTYFLNLERAGASNINGTTGDDRTNYFETLPANRLNLALWLESDRMAYLLDHVNEATFESQRNVVLNERRQSYENAPYGQVIRFIREAVFPLGHPYHTLPIGTPEDLHAATLEDVRNFFRTWYVPNNATLTVAGDLDVPHARALIEQYFGPIARGPAVPRRAAPAPVRLDRETRIAMEAGVELPRVYLAWPTPAYFTPGDGELDLVGNLLSNGRSSRLYRRLVQEMQIAQDVEAGQDSSQLGSMFEITATARPGHTPEEILRVIDEELGHLRDTPVPADELDRARTIIETRMLFGVESVSERANRFNTYNQYVGTPDYGAQDLGRYQHATPADVQNVVRAQLPTDHRVVVMVYPTAGAPVSGRVRAAGGPATPATAPTGGAR